MYYEHRLPYVHNFCGNYIMFTNTFKVLGVVNDIEIMHMLQSTPMNIHGGSFSFGVQHMLLMHLPLSYDRFFS
jgi:hypothetical protein